MNTLTPERLTHLPARTPPSGAGAAATLVALALDTPPGGEHRADLAVLVLRPGGDPAHPAGRLRCALHAGMPAALIAQIVGLPLEHVEGRSPVAVTLTLLDRHLTRPPYRLLGYDTARLETLIGRHRDTCPALAAATLTDITTLTGRDGQAGGLEQWAGQVGVSVGRWAEGTVRQARLIAAIHHRLRTAECGEVSGAR